MRYAAGVMLTDAAGKTLLLRRTEETTKGLWAFPGGWMEDGETAEQTARRELREETGLDYTGPLRQWTRRVKDDVDFTTFAGSAEIFAPTLNDENDLYTWADAEAVKTLPLHPGDVIAFARKDMDELGIAKAIRDGKLASPTRFANLLLVALRVTGTGASYRPAVDEYVWRDKSLYLNDEFLARCNGLPVILEHPPGNMLNSDEFHERIVGTVFLPYIQNDEVWAIAKIWDSVTAQLLEREQLSTSPAVVFIGVNAGETHKTKDGSKVLIEGKPTLTDHLALLFDGARGVWDKGGDPQGVLNQLLPEETTAMADEAKKDAKGDAEEGGKLDKILAHLDSFASRMDAMESKMDASCARMDAYDAKAKKDAEDAAKKDGEKDPDGLKKEREGNDLKVNDKAKKDEAAPGGTEEPDGKEKKADKARKDAEETAKADAAQSEFNRTILAKIDALHSAIPRDVPEDERSKFVEAQSRAERIYQAFGDSAPSAVRGESLLQYRARLANKVKQHSAQWKSIDLTTLKDESVLNVAETQIYADAYSAARSPVHIGAGKLHEVKETDRTGRHISRFYGDPEECWAPFKAVGKAVTGFDIRQRH